MIKSLRMHFVVVTVSFMIAVFSIVFAVNYITEDYWSDLEYYRLLEVVGKSGYFTHSETDSIDQMIQAEIEEENPILGVIFNEKDEIISKQVLGSGQFSEIDDNSLKKIYMQADDKITYNSYVCYKESIDKSHTLLIIMNPVYTEDFPRRLIENIVLFLLAIGALIGISFYLSRFVTGPAERALMREKQFVSDASHELKTPIGAISINAQALELSGASSLYVKNIISEADRMNRLVERLLTLSKLEEKTLISKEKLDLSQIVEEMILTYEAVAYDKKKSIIYDVEKNLDVIGDEDELRQLLTILLDNAIKNSFENTQINVKCYHTKKTYIEVTNEGTGIPDDEIEYVFDRFYSLDQSRNNNSFGLGLAIAKSIVERHKGELTVHSEINKTTTFIAELP